MVTRPSGGHVTLQASFSLRGIGADAGVMCCLGTFEAASSEWLVERRW